MKRILKTTISTVGYYLNFWRILYHLYPVFRKKYILAAITFHRVIPKASSADYLVDYDIGQDLQQYETILKELSGYFDFIDLDRFIKYASGEEKPRNHSMLITFDDADSTFTDYANPILARNKWPTIVFVPTMYVESQNRFWHLRISNIVKNMDDDTWHRISSSGPEFSNELQKVIEQYPKYEKRHQRSISRDIIASLDNLCDDEILRNVERLESLSGMPYNLDIRCMTWDEMKLLEETNVSIESHSVSHAKFKYLSPEAVTTELKESKSKIESVLGKEVRAFCYPAGSFDLDAGRLVEAAGYRAAFTTQSGLCDYPMKSSEMFSIPRISIDGSSRIEINFVIGQLLFKKYVYSPKLMSIAVLCTIAIVCIISAFLVTCG